MLKRMSIKKIMVSTCAIIVLLIIYILPDNSREIKLKNNKIEYISNDIVGTIYLVDSNNYVARTSIPTCKCEGVDIAKDLLEGLIIDGNKSDIIPNGFRSILPSGTSILNLELKDKTLTINFSKELLEVSPNEERKMIESIVYTLTSIKGIDKIKIQVDSSPLTKLPNSKEQLPEELDKNYGIIKTYDLVTTNNIISYTTYYVNKYNNNEYYVPVTKYINNKDNDIIKIIIKELSSSPIYETNLMSYLNAGAVLEDYELLDNNLKLNFNELLLNDINKKNLLEEVIYTISLSMDNYYNNLETVSFYINDEEVYTVNINDIK